MRHRDYMPRDKFELNTWVKKFGKAVEANVNHYGINQEQIKSLLAFILAFANDLDAEQELIDKKQTQVNQTQKDREVLVQFCRMLAQMIKNHPDYTDNVGKEFDIIGAERQIDVASSQPTLVATKVPHGWEFGFGVDNYFTGVNIYRKRPDDTNFIFLATDTRSPYVDNEPMVNGTEYFAYYILGDTEVGKQSDTITIKV